VSERNERCKVKGIKIWHKNLIIDIFIPVNEALKTSYILYDPSQRKAKEEKGIKGHNSGEVSSVNIPLDGTMCPN
jgi:hypothetical protein